ncbi:unnamed protein product, partial [Allacma fusca]
LKNRYVNLKMGFGSEICLTTLTGLQYLVSGLLKKMAFTALKKMAFTVLKYPVFHNGIYGFEGIFGSCRCRRFLLRACD